MWLVSDSWQAPFQVVFGQFQSETVYHKKGWNFYIGQVLQETHVQLQHMLFGMTGKFNWESILDDFLGEVLQKDLSS